MKHPCGEVKVVLDGYELNPEKEYVLATIDYLANGNDGLQPLANHNLLWSDTEKMNVRILDYIRRLSALGLPVQGDPTARFIDAVGSAE